MSAVLRSSLLVSHKADLAFGSVVPDEYVSAVVALNVIFILVEASVLENNITNILSL